MFVRTVTVHCTPDMLIRELAQLVSQRTSIPENVVYFTFNGKRLDGDDGAAHVAITRDCTVVMRGRLKGGSGSALGVKGEVAKARSSRASGVGSRDWSLKLSWRISLRLVQPKEKEKGNEMGSILGSNSTQGDQIHGRVEVLRPPRQDVGRRTTKDEGRMIFPC